MQTEVSSQEDEDNSKDSSMLLLKAEDATELSAIPGRGVCGPTLRPRRVLGNA